MASSFECALRINRNILECKVVYMLYHPARDWGINRNILECKGGKSSLCHVSHSVLIETYWNVKSGGLFLVCLFKTGINRNILECKDYRA